MIAAAELIVAMAFFGYAVVVYRERFIVLGMPIDLLVGVVAGVLAAALMLVSVPAAHIVGVLSLAGFASYVKMIAMTAAIVRGQREADAKRSDEDTKS